MGDPETEVVIPLLKNDIVDLFLSIYNNILKNTVIEFDKRACATIVAVSKGYPGEYKKNIPITNLGTTRMNNNSIIFHAGTKMNGNNVVTNGGRVLAVTSFGTDITDAVNHAKNILSDISFEGMYFRKDIGYEFKNH